MSDGFDILVKRAKSCAARFDGPGLDSAMAELQTWVQVHGPKLAKDPKRKRAVIKNMERLRDVCSVVSGALAEALSDATRPVDRGYGRAGLRDSGASAVLARRYG